jgi:hypothetical protein
MQDKMQLLHKTICEECAFYIKLECTHPDEMAVNCAAVTFCNSFTPSVEIDSPCVSFGNDGAHNTKKAVGWVDDRKPNTK